MYQSQDYLPLLQKNEHNMMWSQIILTHMYPRRGIVPCDMS